MSKMTFTEKNDFIVKHSTADPEHFKKDLELFMRVFPSSPLVPDLQRAQPYNRKALNGRMLLELLNHVCGTSVLENRGIFSKEVKMNVLLNAKVDAQKTVLTTEDLNALTQPELRKLVTDLELETANFKKATLVPVLEAYKTSLADDAPPAHEDEAGTGNPPPPPSPEDETGTDADKKKETPEQNIPE